MHDWFKYDAALKVLVFGLLLGAGLPALFAFGVREAAAADGPNGTRNPALAAVSYAIFALVLLVVTIGVLFIARDFIGHHFGWYILGAKAPHK